jgi:hypothetical protein
MKSYNEERHTDDAKTNPYVDNPFTLDISKTITTTKQNYIKNGFELCWRFFIFCYL